MLSEMLIIALPFLASAIAIVGTAWSLRMAGLALRAQHRLHRLLTERAKLEPQIRELMQLASNNKLDETQTEAARRLIEEAGASLSDYDRHMVEKGLQQPSGPGKRRYITQLVSA